MKLCGHKESCFVCGDKIWCEYGGIICHHYDEIGVDECISVCGITNKEVQTYSNESDHIEFTKELRIKKLDSL